MASRALQPFRRTRHDDLSEQIANLRRELASIADAVSEYSGDTFGDLQHSAAALAREARQHGAVVAQQMGKQARYAGKVVQEHPVPAIVAIGTIALLAALVFVRD